MQITIDRKKAVPVHRQVRDAIEQAVFLGILPVGGSLPSVRDLAETAGVAPMTVSKVYAELKAAGVIEARAGSGTFVADGPLAHLATHEGLRTLQTEADALIDAAFGAGLRAEDLAILIAVRIAARQRRSLRKRVVLVGLFAEATDRYAANIAAQIGDAAVIEATTLARITDDPERRAEVSSADLVLTFATLGDDLSRLLPQTRIVSIRFIPSEDTRMALAAIDPMARIAVVSRFEGFLPVLTLGARRFAAHVQDVVALTLDDPGLERKLADRDVVVISTGAEAALDFARPGAGRIEYRHIPDPGDIERLVVPAVTAPIMPAVSGRKEAS
ncbi:MAG: GntR family transcriptional regulator [Paracoccaceae bacterium]